MEFKLIKKISYKGALEDAPKDYDYWKIRTQEERIAAVEELRKATYKVENPVFRRSLRL